MSEFQPGVPWKGIQSIDPESDPYMTPGSMMGIPGPSSLNDTEHQLLRDNTGTYLDSSRVTTVSMTTVSMTTVCMTTVSMTKSTFRALVAETV